MTQGGGTLYKVDPDGDLEEDPDFRGDAVSFTAPRARVIAVAEQYPVMTSTEFTMISGRYMTWADGTRVYDRNGYRFPAPEELSQGLEAWRFRTLGPWVPLDIGARVMESAFRAGRPPSPGQVSALIADADRVLLEIAKRHGAPGTAEN